MHRKNIRSFFKNPAQLSELRILLEILREKVLMFWIEKKKVLLSGAEGTLDIHYILIRVRYIKD